MRLAMRMLGGIQGALPPGRALFPEAFFDLLVWGALGGSALGLLVLLYLILRDRQRGEIW